MESYRSKQRLPMYQKYAAFLFKYATLLFTSLGNALQPIPKRTLSERFQKGNLKHYTRMENNFNMHVVPHIICYDCNWGEKARVFYITATPVLGAKLKEQFENAGTLELDRNFRISKFESAKFTLQRDANHTSYHKQLCDKLKREYTEVQDAAFETYMDQVDQRNAEMDYNDEERNEWTCHLRQEALKFMMLLLTFLGQRFPAVKASIDQVTEKLIKLNDYLDVNLELSASFVEASLVQFVDVLVSDNSNSPDGPEIKSVIETMMNLLNNERNLQLVNDSLGESLQEKFENMDQNRKVSAEKLCEALEEMITNLKKGNTNNGANAEHANADQMGNVNAIDVDNAAAMNDEHAVGDPVEIARLEVNRDDAVPVRNRSRDPDEDLMRIHRQEEEHMEVDNDEVVHVDAGLPVVNENVDAEEVNIAPVNAIDAEHAVGDPLEDARLAVVRENADAVREVEGALDGLIANNLDENLVRIDRQVENQMEVGIQEVVHADVIHPVLVIENVEAVRQVEGAEEDMNANNLDEVLVRIDRQVEDQMGVGNPEVVNANAVHPVINENVDAEEVNDAAVDAMDVDQAVEDPVEVARPAVEREDVDLVREVEEAFDGMDVNNPDEDLVRINRQVENQMEVGNPEVVHADAVYPVVVIENVEAVRQVGGAVEDINANNLDEVLVRVGRRVEANMEDGVAAVNAIDVDLAIENPMEVARLAVVRENADAVREVEGALDGLIANNLDENLVRIDRQVENQMEVGIQEVVHADVIHPVLVIENVEAVRQVEGAEEDMNANNLDEVLVRIDRQVEDQMGVGNPEVVNANAVHPVINENVDAEEVNDAAVDAMDVDQAVEDPVEVARPAVEREDVDLVREVEEAFDGMDVNNPDENLVRIDRQVENQMEVGNPEVVHADAVYPVVVIENVEAVRQVGGAVEDINANNLDEVLVRVGRRVEANMEDGVAAVNAIDVDLAIENPMEVARLAMIREDANPVREVEGALDGLDVNNLDEDLVRIDRHVDNQMEVGNAEVVHADAVHPVVVNENIDPLRDVEGAVDNMDAENPDEALVENVEMNRREEEHMENGVAGVVHVDAGLPVVNENVDAEEVNDAPVNEIDADHAVGDPVGVVRQAVIREDADHVREVEKALDGMDAIIPDEDLVRIDRLVENQMEVGNPKVVHADAIFPVVVIENVEAVRQVEGGMDANNLDEVLERINRQVEAHMEDSVVGIVHLDAVHPVINENVDAEEVNDVAVDAMDVDQAVEDPVEVARPAVEREDASPVREVEEALDGMDAINPDEDLVRIDRQVEDQMEVGNPEVVHADAAHPVVVNEIIDPLRDVEGAADNMEAENPDEALVRIDRREDEPMEIGDAGVVHADAVYPVINENVDAVEVNDAAVDAMDVDQAVEDPVEVAHPAVEREEANPVRHVEGAADNVNNMEAENPDEELVEFDRQVKIRIDHAAVNNARADRPLVENNKASRIVAEDKNVVFSDLRTHPFFLESVQFIKNLGETLASDRDFKNMTRIDNLLDNVGTQPTLSMSYFYFEMTNTFERLFKCHIDKRRFQISRRNFDRGLLCDDMVAYFCEKLDQCTTMKVFSDPLRRECSKLLDGRNAIIPYKAIGVEIYRCLQRVKRNVQYDVLNIHFK